MSNLDTLNLVADLLSLCDETVDPDTYVNRVWVTTPNTIKIQVVDRQTTRIIQVRTTEVKG